VNLKGTWDKEDNNYSPRGKGGYKNEGPQTTKYVKKGILGKNL